jgi:hypothetical protein
MEANPTPADTYGVVKAPGVQAWLQQQSAAVRQAVEDILARLSEHPRRPKSLVTMHTIRSMPVLALRVEAAAGKFVVVYFVEERAARVTVVGVERVFV